MCVLLPSLQAVETCVAAAGFSVGEFAALVFAGAMNFSEGKHDIHNERFFFFFTFYLQAEWKTVEVWAYLFPPVVLVALYAVKVRAEAMQKASELVPSGMLSVIGRPQAQYKYACLQAKEHCKSLGIQEPVCSVANYLFPDGRVIAGHQQVMPPPDAVQL